MVKQAWLPLVAAVMLIAAAPLAAQSFPDGPGKEVLEKKCGTCHAPEQVTTFGRSAEEWHEVIVNMVDLGAEVTEEESKVLLEYLTKHWPLVGVTLPADKPAETPAESPAETPAESPAETPADGPADKPGESPAEKPADGPAETPAESPADKPAEDPHHKPADKQPADKPAETPAPQAAPVGVAPVASHGPR